MAFEESWDETGRELVLFSSLGTLIHSSRLFRNICLFNFNVHCPMEIDK